MKGFIEVTGSKSGKKILIGVRSIAMIQDFAVYVDNCCVEETRENYSELKALIEAAMETNECDDCPYNDARVELPKNYEIPELEGTTDALNHLGIRKEK